MGSKWHLGSKTFGTQTVWGFKNKVEETFPRPPNLLKPYELSVKAITDNWYCCYHWYL